MTGAKLLMRLSLMLLLTVFLVGDASALKIYVNGHQGQDNWPGTPTAPKETINAAIQVASDGDTIVVNNGGASFIYDGVDASQIIDRPTQQKKKELIFTSEGDQPPQVRRWKFWANTTFIGQFTILDTLHLRKAEVINADQVSMANLAWVVRRNGSIASGRLGHKGKTNFRYESGGWITTGLEIPAEGDTTHAWNLWTANNPNSGDSTNLELNESLRIWGQLMTVGQVDLNTHRLEILRNPGVNLTHVINGDVFDGWLIFLFNANAGGNRTVTLNGDYKLPRVKAETWGTTGTQKLIIQTTKEIQELLAIGAAFIDVLNAGAPINPIGMITNLGRGIIELMRADTVKVAGMVTMNNNSIGKILFNVPAPVFLGGLYLLNGTVQFQDNVFPVYIDGTTKFAKGTFFMRGARQLILRGANNQFGEGDSNVNFSTSQTGPVQLTFVAYAGVPSQEVALNRPGTIWYGTMFVGNRNGVTFQDGYFTVLQDVTFDSGEVKLENCILSIGNDGTPLGAGNFTNNSGYVVNPDISPGSTAAPGLDAESDEIPGYINMNGNVGQTIMGDGNFGSIAANCNGNITLGSDITCVQVFYLVRSDIDFNGYNLNFEGAPTIIRNNGKFLSDPNFNVTTNLWYVGNQKSTDREVPDDLGDFRVRTENNDKCPKPDHRGWVILKESIIVKGTFEIYPNQALVVNDGYTITIMGNNVIIDGYLIHGQTGGTNTIILGNPTGTTIISSSYLPSIRVLSGSMNNFVQAIGLVKDVLTNNGYTNVADFMCGVDDIDDAIANGNPGDIVFVKNGADSSSSLKTKFTGTNIDHIDQLKTHERATLILDSNLSQLGDLTHRKEGKIDVGEFTHTIKGANVLLEGKSETVGTTGKVEFKVGDTDVNLKKQGGEDPVIHANVDVNLDNAGRMLNLLPNGSSPSYMLTIFGDFNLIRGQVWLGTATAVDLILSGQNFRLYADGSVMGPGILFLNPILPPPLMAATPNSGVMSTNAVGPMMNWYVYGTPTINNLTVQNNVTIIGEERQVTILNSYVHELGTIDLDGCDLIIGPVASFLRIAGTYMASTGFLVLQSPNFDQGSSNFEIPNFRINTGQHFAAANTGIYTVTRMLDLANGFVPGGAPQTPYMFTHNGTLKVADGVIVRYHSGTFNQAPNYLGIIHLYAVHNSHGNELPETVWPNTNPDLVQFFALLTWASRNSWLECPCPTTDNVVKNNLAIVLPIDHVLNNRLLLRNGILFVKAGRTLTFADNLQITRVDGKLMAGSETQIIKNGDGYVVKYCNNTPDASGDSLKSGFELPANVKELIISRWQNLVNKFTAIMSAVSVWGDNTLYIRNNTVIMPNAKITVYDDVYFQNESDVFPKATDPICVFNAPLEFAGDQDQSVFVPEGGIDLTGRLFLAPAPPAPANILINKTYPHNRVTVIGGDIEVGTVFFVNGLLDSEEDNTIIIPAPFPGLGQGFDRSGVVPPNVSHIVGRVTKRLINGIQLNFSSNQRNEFPTGSDTEYRPWVITFPQQSGLSTIPNGMIITVRHMDGYPQGINCLPIEDGIAPGEDINGYADHYWQVWTNGTYPQYPWHLEVRSTGFTNYDDVNDLRIIRRHGDVDEVDNCWLLQGNTEDYDNAEYLDGTTVVPTVINRNSMGGLREDGAIFTLGLKDSTALKYHYRPVWWGPSGPETNPVSPMTIYVSWAEYSPGNPLVAGDEVGVFDGDVCVGVGKLTDVIERDSPMEIICSADDPTTTGQEGFVSGHAISFKVWNQREATEYRPTVTFYPVNAAGPAIPPVPFEPFASTRVELTNATLMQQTQMIRLDKGWNIFSLAVDPPDDPNILMDPVGTDGILNDIEGNVVKVQDENGNAIEKIFGSWQIGIPNNGQWLDTEGYYIKVSENDTLYILGDVIVTPLDIALKAGWNIISYPCYHSEQDAELVFQDLITDGFLEKVQDEKGRPFEYLAFAGWQNLIGDLKPGEGYYVKVNTACTLTIECAGQGGAPKALVAEAEVKPEHFKIDIESNPYEPMNIYVAKATLGKGKLMPGDEVGVFDGEHLVGAAMVTREITGQEPLHIIAARNDGSGIGFSDGHHFNFKVWHASSATEIDVEVDEIYYQSSKTGDRSGSVGFEGRGTATVQLLVSKNVDVFPADYNLGQNYPNPFNPSTKITFGLPEDSHVKIQVFDLTGKLVTTLVDGEKAIGYHTVEWYGNDHSGNKVATGIYFYRLTAGSFTQTKKMVFTK